MAFRLGVAAFGCLFAAVYLQGCGQHLEAMGVDGEMVDKMQLATMQNALGAAGACPIVGEAVKEFLDGAADSLSQAVKESLSGPCLNLTSPACGTVMVDKSTELLLYKVEKIIGLEKSREMLQLIRQPVLTIKDKVGASNCQVRALDAANQADGVEDQVGASELAASKENVAKLKPLLAPMTTAVSNAATILGATESVEVGWDKLKGTAKETFVTVATPVMHEMQKHFPKEYEELVVAGKADELAVKLAEVIKEDMGKLIMRELELFCPGKEEKDMEDGLARDTDKFSDSTAADLDKKIKEMIATVAGDDVHGLIMSTAGSLKTSYEAKKAAGRRLSVPSWTTGGDKLIPDLEKKVEDCTTNYKEGLAAIFSLYAVQPKWMEELGHLKELYETFPAAQHKHVAMLYLRTTALASGHAAAKDASSYASAFPAILSVVALSVFGVAFFGRSMKATPRNGGWAQMRSAGAEDDLEFAREHLAADNAAVRTEVQREFTDL